MKRTWAGEVRNVSLSVASAVNAEGHHKILGVCEDTKVNKCGWLAFPHLLGAQGERARCRHRAERPGSIPSEL
ncbi:transposase [Pedomonas sp.]|uniref:transposase n=1 Tax=Pedomonas sp. TaxID=2976421 RepID=UPI0039C8E88F